MKKFLALVIALTVTAATPAAAKVIGEKDCDFLKDLNFGVFREVREKDNWKRFFEKAKADAKDKKEKFRHQRSINLYRTTRDEKMEVLAVFSTVYANLCKD